MLDAQCSILNARVDRWPLSEHGRRPRSHINRARERERATQDARRSSALRSHPNTHTHTCANTRQHSQGTSATCLLACCWLKDPCDRRRWWWWRCATSRCGARSRRLSIRFASPSAGLVTLRALTIDREVESRRHSARAAASSRLHSARAAILDWLLQPVATLYSTTH